MNLKALCSHCSTWHGGCCSMPSKPPRLAHAWLAVGSAACCALMPCNALRALGSGFVPVPEPDAPAAAPAEAQGLPPANNFGEHRYPYRIRVHVTTWQGPGPASSQKGTTPLLAWSAPVVPHGSRLLHIEACVARQASRVASHRRRGRRRPALRAPAHPRAHCPSRCCAARNSHSRLRWHAHLRRAAALITDASPPSIDPLGSNVYSDTK